MFDKRAIEPHLTAALPSQGDLQALSEVFRELTRGGMVDLKEFTKAIGEARLHGVIRSLEREQRAEAIAELLPSVTGAGSTAAETITKLLNASRNLVELSEVVERVGAEIINSRTTPNGTPIFGESVMLGKIGFNLRSDELLPEPDGSAETAREIIEQLGKTFEHNARLFRQAGGELNVHPFAINSERLANDFREARAELGEMLIDPEGKLGEFAGRWTEKLKILTATGVGVFDSPELQLSSGELIKIREALLEVPPSVYLFQGVVLNLTFKEQPDDAETALGGFNMGRLFLFPHIREATPGIDCPAGMDPTKYAAVHECAHGCHTYCMQEFRAISGWVAVTDWKARHPMTNEQIKLSPETLIAGNTVKLGGEEFVVADHTEPRTATFMLGGETLSIDITNHRSCGWLYRKGATSASEYGMSNPLEDYAESLAAFILQPERLKERAPEKYEFMNYLYGK